jgi:hypothetical protein
MDDDFMSACLADNYEAVELILRIILNKKNITIQSIKTQEQLKNLQGRSAVLDVHATDSTGREFNVEIQRSDKGAGVKRARYNSSLLDSYILKPRDDTDNIPDSYVIFITENDVLKGNQAVYPVERYVSIGDNKVLFGDGSHIIYVNGKYRGEDEIGKLMHDFSCSNPDDMNYEELAKKARYFKEDEKGVANMCRMMEEMKKETAKEIATRMIRGCNLSLEEIATYVPLLSLDELKELRDEILQSV